GLAREARWVVRDHARSLVAGFERGAQKGHALDSGCAKRRRWPTTSDRQRSLTPAEPLQGLRGPAAVGILEDKGSIDAVRSRPLLFVLGDPRGGERAAIRVESRYAAALCLRLVEPAA